MERPVAISVIIPTRNRLEFLREAVASVRAQSWTDWELIVVDDCSEDGTGDWLGSLADARIRVLRMERRRERSAARNAGLAAARGEYVLFLDDDDHLFETALASLWSALRRQPQAFCAIGALAYRNGRGSWVRIAHPRRRVFRNIWPDLLFDWMPLPGQSLLRRSAVLAAGGWNETISVSEDYEFWLRVGRFGPAVLIPHAVMGYRVHPGQTFKSGWWARRTMHRRIAVQGLEEDEKRSGERTTLALRWIRRTWRESRHGRPVKGLCCWWRAVLSAPWLLFSPITRGAMLRPGIRCGTEALLGQRTAAKLRTVKRHCGRILKRKPRSGDAGLPSAKTFRSTVGQP